jgi:hypothetical protein
MKMILLFSLLLSSFISMSWAGGVGVGNAKPLFVGGINIPSFDKEEELALHVEKLIPQIQDGSFDKIQEYIQQGECSGKKVGFHGLETFTVYEFKDKKLTRRNTGYINVTLEDCNRPDLIQSEDRPSQLAE